MTIKSIDYTSFHNAPSELDWSAIRGSERSRRLIRASKSGAPSSRQLPRRTVLGSYLDPAANLCEVGAGTRAQ